MYKLINQANSFYGLRETITDEQFSRLTDFDKQEYQKVEVNIPDGKPDMGNSATLRTPSQHYTPKRKRRIPQLVSIVVARLLSR